MVPRTRIVALAVAAGTMLAVILFTELRTREQAFSHTTYYGKTLAPLLWEVNAETAQEYIDLILTSHPYRELRIVHDDGTTFVQSSVRDPDGGAGRLLRAAGLIRDIRVDQPISYKGVFIGRIQATWINRSIQVYLILAAVFGVGYGIVGLIHASRRARHERERAEHALQESRVRLHTVVSGAPVILFALDRHGVFTLIEGKGLEKLGLRHSDLEGRSIEQSGTFSPSAADDFRRALGGETFVSTHESQGLVFESWHSPLRDRDGTITGVIGVATDITELRHALHALEERDRNIRRELALARTIHRALMPTELPTLPGFEFGMLFVPSGDIGGDFVDFVPFRDEARVGVVFADITGHGVPAALLAAMFRVLINDVLHRESDRSAAASITELNRRVAKEFPPCNFASTFYLELDAAARRLRYVNASQEAALLVRADGSVTDLGLGGPALGLIPGDLDLDPGYEEGSVDLHPGDTVLLYTDGLIEIENERGEMLSREILAEWVRHEAGQDAQSVVDHLYARAREHAGARELPDDVAILILRVLAD